MSFVLAISPCLALPISSQAQSTNPDPNANKLQTSSDAAVLRTQTPPLNYLPSLDEIKQKADNPELKKPIKTKEKLPTANRCRPGDKICQDYWKKQGKPSNNIGQFTPYETASPLYSLRNLLAWNSFSSPFDLFRETSDVPVGVGPFAPKASTSPMLFQGGVTYGGWQTEMTQGRNRMGSTDLFSGNYHWSIPILGLPGRAGHDLGLRLAYNSHVWVKTSSGVMRMIDVDEIVGNPGGGFMLGLPFLRAALHTTRNAQNAYLLVLPSGQAVELIRRGGTTSSQVYESIDGSVLRLVVETSANQYLFFPDGTRLRFQYFQCTEMRDRNGNLITATYDANGQLQKITDTLGREINFTYGPYFEISDITQSRKDENGNPVTVTLAHFGYSDITINTNFASSSNVPNGTIIPMLTSALLADGALYKFEYTSYGQVKKISHYAPQVANPSTNSLCAPNVTSGCDYRLLSYTTYNLPSTNDPTNNAVQSDCPRFTSRFDWAFEWNAGVTTTFAYASDNSWGQATAADGTTQREYFNLAANNAESWKDGLPFKMETYASGQTPGSSTPKKTTLTTWQNDATWGPRVANSTVTDGENNSSRYTLIEYNQNYNLPTDVWTYKGTGTGNMLSYAYTSYLLNSTYIKTSGWGNTQRWIIGLPSASYAYQPNNAAGSSYTTLSKVTNQYDQSGYLEHQLPGAGTIFNHDTTNIGLAFLAGRANLSSTTRWDATDENNASKAITSYTKYNTTGAPTTQYLPDNNLTGRTTTISYLDAFSDSAANNTLAYPTTVTDPDNNQSKLQYRFDIGAVTRTQDPKMLAADSTKGIVKKYDALGRLTRVDNQFSNGYTRHSYDTALYWTMSFTKADTIGNELYTTTIYDGHRRRRASVTAHPNSTGSHRSQYQIYDAMGRLVQWSNPTEINGYWIPAGDDAAGYAWSQQTYDWKGRPLVTADQAGKPKTYAYGGCGCTGEATVTVTDEVGRKTRTLSDTFLDHTMQVNKTEILNSDGVTVYSTTASVTKPAERKSYVLEVAGATTDYSSCASNNCNSTTRQQTTTTYNGLGRVLQQQVPQQSGATPYTAYEYYADGSLKKSTDARGAYAEYIYNKRGLATGINYTEVGGAQTTPDLTFEYDANGNRTRMSESTIGQVDYSYDVLSRMQYEERTFVNGPTGAFRLSYTHDLNGQLSSITDVRYGTTVSYVRDLAGRLTSVNGTGYSDNGQPITQFAYGTTYRAWDTVKEMNYSNNLKMTLAYDARLLATNYTVKKISDQSTVAGAAYQYHHDRKTSFASDVMDNKFDRAYTWDHAERLWTAKTGDEARGGTATDGPYRQTYNYDVFGNLTNRDYRLWTQQLPDTTSYQNNLRQGATYDNDGNLLVEPASPGNKNFNYDVVKRNITFFAGLVGGGQTGHPTMPDREITQQYDGNGNYLKRVETTRIEEFVNGGPQTNITTTNTTTYYLCSSLLGQAVVTVMDAQANKTKGYVYAQGVRLAEQTIIAGSSYLTWRQTNPVTGNWIETTSTPGVTRAEHDPLGAEVGTTNPYLVDPVPTYPDLKQGEPLYIEGGDPFDRSGGYERDGLPMSASEYQRLVRAGALSPKPGSYDPTGIAPFGLNIKPLPGLSEDVDSYIRDIAEPVGVGQLPVQLPTPPKPSNLILIIPNTTLVPRPCIFNINLSIGITPPAAEEIMSMVWDIFREAGHFVTFNNPSAASNTRRGNYTSLVYEDDVHSSRVRGEIGNDLGYTPGKLYPIQNGPLVGLRIADMESKGYVSITRHKQLFAPSDVLGEIAKTIAHENGHYALNMQDHSNDSGLMADGAPGRYFSAEQAKRLSSLCN